MAWSMLAHAPFRTKRLRFGEDGNGDQHAADGRAPRDHRDHGGDSGNRHLRVQVSECGAIHDEGWDGALINTVSQAEFSNTGSIARYTRPTIAS